MSTEQSVDLSQVQANILLPYQKANCARLLFPYQAYLRIDSIFGQGDSEHRLLVLSLHQVPGDVYLFPIEGNSIQNLGYDHWLQITPSYLGHL